MVDNIKLPTSLPSRQDFGGLTQSPEKFFPAKLSKQGQKRVTKAREEAYIRTVVLMGTALLEKMGEDYRISAKRYELKRLIEEADYYQTLVATAKTPGGKAVARQAVKQWTVDLYTIVWSISTAADGHTRKLIDDPLYPASEEEKSLLQELKEWMGQGGT